MVSILYRRIGGQETWAWRAVSGDFDSGLQSATTRNMAAHDAFMFIARAESRSGINNFPGFARVNRARAA